MTGRNRTIVLVLAGLLLLTVLVVLLLQQQKKIVPAVSNPVTAFTSGTSSLEVSASSTSSELPRQPPAGQTEYDNVHYGFSLFYPSDLAVKSYDEGGGASTITFQNVQTAQGFQIFIVPYAGNQISQARFEEDEPSGVVRSPQNVTIAGVPAISFYSTDPALGDTAEIWFIHGGYLFEVTTLEPLSGWLSQIMESWQFQ